MNSMMHIKTYLTLKNNLKCISKYILVKIKHIPISYILNACCIPYSTMAVISENILKQVFIVFNNNESINFMNAYWLPILTQIKQNSRNDKQRQQKCFLKSYYNTKRRQN